MDLEQALSSPLLSAGIGMLAGNTGPTKSAAAANAFDSGLNAFQRAQLLQSQLMKNQWATQKERRQQLLSNAMLRAAGFNPDATDLGIPEQGGETNLGRLAQMAAALEGKPQWESREGFSFNPYTGAYGQSSSLGDMMVNLRRQQVATAQAQAGAAGASAGANDALRQQRLATTPLEVERLRAAQAREQAMADKYRTEAGRPARTASLVEEFEARVGKPRGSWTEADRKQFEDWKKMSRMHGEFAAEEEAVGADSDPLGLFQ